MSAEENTKTHNSKIVQTIKTPAEMSGFLFCMFNIKIMQKNNPEMFRGYGLRFFLHYCITNFFVIEEFVFSEDIFAKYTPEGKPSLSILKLFPSSVVILRTVCPKQFTMSI